MNDKKTNDTNAVSVLLPLPLSAFRQSSGYAAFSSAEEDIVEQLNIPDIELQLRALNKLQQLAQVRN